MLENLHAVTFDTAEVIRSAAIFAINVYARPIAVIRDVAYL